MRLAPRHFMAGYPRACISSESGDALPAGSLA